MSANVDVIDLRRRDDCNPYVVERRRALPLRQEEDDDLAVRIVPLGLPPRGAVGPVEPNEEIITEGAVALSAARAIAARYVPAKDLPGDDWRSDAR